ncbi:hypothetical protein BH11PSE11_BH11PSE11_24720 [soil metagenome]
MNAFHTLIIVIQVISAITIVALVLLQHGKGADMGAAFGSGASGSLFGASGSSNFMSKSTGVAAAIFFISTLFLAYMGNTRATASTGVMENLPSTSTPAVPATPAVAGSAPAAASAPSKPATAPVVKDGVPPASNAAPKAAGQSDQIPK